MLNLSIVPVGPRATWKTPIDDEWLFALQIAASFSDEPPEDEAERREWALALLPWRLLAENPTTEIEVAWQLFRSNNTIKKSGQRRARAIGNLEPLEIRNAL